MLLPGLEGGAPGRRHPAAHPEPADIDVNDFKNGVRQAQRRHTHAYPDQLSFQFAYVAGGAARRQTSS